MDLASARSPKSKAPPEASAELYDQVAGTFTETGSMADPRADQSATRLPDGRVLVVGGVGGNGETDSAELYDPASGLFNSAGHMDFTRSSQAAALLPDGRVLLAGGWASIATAELYDPDAAAFVPLGTMSVGRTLPVAVVLQDGSVLITGGAGTFGSTIKSELFVPGKG